MVRSAPGSMSEVVVVEDPWRWWSLLDVAKGARHTCARIRHPARLIVGLVIFTRAACRLPVPAGGTGAGAMQLAA